METIEALSIHGMASRPNSGFLDRDLPYLPAEIKSLVADFLIKSDLKNVRLVSRDWSAPATPSLFDRVFVSPYDKDLQIFANITHDPILASSIKELICDTSTIPELSYEEYFYQLRREVSSITWRPEKRFPFRSSSRRINRFVNGITQDESEPGELLSKYGREQLIENGYRFWRELSAEENEHWGSALYGTYYTTLCAGLRRLPNLQAVKMDDDMWDRNRMHTSLKMSLRYPLDALNPYHALGVIESGSPLSRGWNPWHLRPKRLEHDPELLASRHISQVTQALAVTKRQVKRFKYETLLNNGISPMVFSMFEITDPFAHCMSTALCRLELLELQITPCESQLTNEGSANGLGFLPQLLEQMTGLKRLRLTLETAERVTQRGDYRLCGHLTTLVSIIRKSFQAMVDGHTLKCFI